jgi:hypothetical protein
MPRVPLLLVPVLLAAALATAQAAPLTLERIMADPDWIGPAVERPYWSLDGGSVIYSLKRPGSPVRDLWRVPAGGGAPRRVAPAELATLDAASPVFDRERRRAAFVRNGDVFVRALGSRQLVQVTRTPALESAPQFSADGRTLQFRSGTDWLGYDLGSGVTGPVALLVLGKDPDEKKPGELERLQLRLIATLRRDRADRDSLKREAERLRSADPTRSPLPVYLGDDVKLDRSVVSPAGRWLLAVTTPKSYDEGRVGKMPVYVTESGYEETEETRTRVGRNEPAPQTLWLVDLKTRTREKVAYTPLPGIKDDLLASVRAENERAARAAGPGKGAAGTNGGGTDPPKADSAGAGKNEAKERSLEVSSIVFNPQGSEVLLRLSSNDNKDRWLATVDFEKHALRPGTPADGQRLGELGLQRPRLAAPTASASGSNRRRPATPTST